jgi:hypothetical protein
MTFGRRGTKPRIRSSSPTHHSAMSGRYLIGYNKELSKEEVEALVQEIEASGARIEARLDSMHAPSGFPSAC